MTAALAFENLTLGYNRHPAVHHLSGEVAEGALLAVIGPNGGGKSTLFRGIAGHLKPFAGSIRLNGVRVRDIAYLPQVAEIDRSFPIQVFDFVAMGLWARRGAFKAITRADCAAVEHALEQVGLTGFEARTIGTLSGGQMQRILFARLILQDARVIVLDEPFNAIDTKTTADLLALVQRWHSDGRTVLAALHDDEMVRKSFPETLLLARSPVAWGATGEVLTPENLARARAMCEAFDDAAEACVDVPRRQVHRVRRRAMFFQERRDCILPRETGEGDRPKGGGGGARQHVRSQSFEIQHAPTTMLRMVPLPRKAGEDRDLAALRVGANALLP